MSKQINTQITGTIDNIIYYKSGNEYLFRAKGNTGKQAPIAKQQAGFLGRASSISAKLRAAFKPILPLANGRKLMYGLNNSLQQWLKTGQSNEIVPIDSIPILKGFSFTSNTGENDFYVSMPISRKSDGTMGIQIPAFDSPNPIYPLPFSGQINLHIIAASCNISNPADIVSFERTLDIDYTGIPIPAQELLLSLQTKPGSITVVAASINKTTAGIVGALFN